MQSSRTILEPPGTKAKPAAFQTAKGRAFAEFVEKSGGEAYARLVEVRRVNGTGSGDVVVMDVQVERPQKIVHSIFHEERIAVLFFDDDAIFPDVLALRADFPHVPHTNLRDTELPRGLCLYDQPYENVKLDWTPARFLNRIRYWLQHTAMGTLHGEDQPLEPLLLGARQRLILPGDYSLTELQNQTSLFQVFPCGEVEDEITLVARHHNAGQNQKAEFVAAIFTCQEQTHGVIRYQPNNLEQLHDFCAAAGLDLGNELVTKAKAWFLDKPAKEILSCRLIIILLLPKRRRDGSQIETVEKWAFMTMKTVEEVGIALDVYGKGAGTGFIIGGPPFSKAKLAQIPIGTLQVLHGLSANRAAAMNGTEVVTAPIVGIGMGALGSQVFNNLIRSGFGRWTIVDPDTLRPHNCARHFLGEWAVGHNKAKAMAHIANAVLDQPRGGERIAKAIPADFIKPGKHARSVETSYEAAEIVLDLSASVAVSRHCASSKVLARHIGAFLSPSGANLIVTAEDKKRTVRLDWLEMLHYRSVLVEDTLRSSLQTPDARFRYGNSCRDTFATRQTNDATRNVLKNVFELRARKLIQVRAAGRLGWIRETGAKTRMIDVVEQTLLPKRAAWDDINDPVEVGFVTIMLDWTWSQGEVLEAVREAYQVDKGQEESVRASFYNCVLRWLEGRTFEEIAASAELEVGKALGVQVTAVTFVLQSSVEQAIALLAKLLEAQNRGIAQAVLDFPDHLRFGVATATARILAAAGLRHRRAAVEFGLTEVLAGLIDQSRDAVLRRVREALQQHAEAWREHLGALVYENTVEDVTPRA